MRWDEQTVVTHTFGRQREYALCEEPMILSHAWTSLDEASPDLCRLLLYLIQCSQVDANRAIPYEELKEQKIVIGTQPALRKSIERLGAIVGEDTIKTIRNRGYKFVDPGANLQQTPLNSRGTGITFYSHADARAALQKSVSSGKIARLDVIAIHLEGTRDAIVDILRLGGTVRAVVPHPDVLNDILTIERLGSNVTLIHADCPSARDLFLLRTQHGREGMPCVMAYDKTETFICGYIGWYIYDVAGFEPSRAIATENPVIVMEGELRADAIRLQKFAVEEFQRHWDRGSSCELQKLRLLVEQKIKQLQRRLRSQHRPLGRDDASATQRLASREG